MQISYFFRHSWQVKLGTPRQRNVSVSNDTSFYTAHDLILSLLLCFFLRLRVNIELNDQSLKGFCTDKKWVSMKKPFFSFLFHMQKTYHQNNFIYHASFENIFPSTNIWDNYTFSFGLLICSFLDRYS